MNHVLEVSGLSKIFPGGLFEKDRQVLFDVGFKIPRGATAGFVGGNGQGKTTTLKCLLGFVHPNSGNIRFFGEPFSRNSKMKIGYLPERPYLYEFLTGRELLQFHWNLAGGAKSGFQSACQNVLKTV